MGADLPAPVFVVGTGRSGTHWIGETLARHPQIRATIEVEPLFGWSIQAALRPDREADAARRLISAYAEQIRRSAPRRYLDKSHPNLWIAERLSGAFPGARFLAMQRDPFATVASMLRHPAVLAWHTRWRELPVPNRFLGISVEMAPHYDELPLAAKCALRWVAHHRRIAELCERLGDAVLPVSYEALAQRPVAVIEEIGAFLGLAQPMPVPVVSHESLGKWKTQLSVADVHDIEGQLGLLLDG